MAREEITNHQLALLRNDVLNLTNSSPAFRLFFKEKINRFFSFNAISLKVLNTKMEALVNQYVKHDEEGKPVTEQKEDGTTHYVFSCPEDEEKYKQEWEAFMNRSVKIEI